MNRPKIKHPIDSFRPKPAFVGCTLGPDDITDDIPDEPDINQNRGTYRKR